MVTSTFLVEHFEDHGNEQTITGDESFFFIPGNGSHPEDESYGVYTKVKCADERPPVGGSTTCTVSFAAPPEEIQNFYWQVDGVRLAAWPGQVV
jgi:hypothetical protein